MMSPVASEQSHSAAAEEAPAHTEPASPESIKLKEETNEDEGRSEKLDTGQQQQSKGEKFDGKIVYNPDGSAYIMEDKDDDDVLPKQEGSVETEPSSEVTNAFFISKSSAYYNALYGQAYVKMLQDKKVPETPVVHSYRVYSPMRESLREDDAAARLKLPPPLAEYATVPVKPVLMCFVCKLSFGCTETFANHCAEGHSIELSSEEKAILESKNSSAIIQNMGSKEKEPAVSFLEPILSPNGSKLSPPFSSGAITSLLAAAAAANQFPKVPITSSSSSSLPLPLRTPSTSSSPRIPTPTSPSAADSRMSPPEAMGFSIIAAAGMRSNTVSPAAGSPSPVQSLPHTPPAYPTMPTNANMLQGTTIGACPDHVNGRPTGVECSKCDLILNQSRLSSMGWNVSRNSCKTLKCPKCNWHYKYQETLEIHMKEKHPDSETTCIYCITGQQHPRLARGETYTCGYKPYRCEVCNYSTTTKGNLSIHMQSDKHLNNMQELQNGGIPTSMADAVVSASSPKLPITSAAGSLTPRSLPPPPSMTSPSPLASPSKQKPSWRCDVCNYETNVARNLRIHMTSEKHTHNMMSLQQQGAKAAAMQQMGSMQLPPGFPGMLPGLDPKQLLQLHHNLATAAGGGLMNPPPTSSPSPSEQAAMADLAYNQAVLAQLMSGGQFPGPPPDFSALLAASAGAAQDPADAEPPPEPTDPNPRHLFTCCVCRQFGCDSVDELSLHLSHDRSRTRENEVSIVIGGNSLCQLCNYKTNLKANFQLHCKTDKHLQRLSHVNHIKEGGACNEWKLRFLASLNPVELRCNACDFYTNSPHKLQVHISNQQHQVSSLLFFHLQKMERRSLRPSGLSYNCVLCQFSAPGKHLLMVHVRSMKHLQMEQVHQLKKRAEGNQAQTEIGEIFQVSEEDEDQNDAVDPSSSSSTDAISCPLCQDNFEGQSAMESHAMSVHSVNTEGLQRLQSLISGAHWLKKEPSQKSSGVSSSSVQDLSSNDKDELKSESLASTSLMSATRKGDPGFNYSMDKYLDPNRPFKCDVCKESFTQKNILLVHYNSVSHLHRLKKSMQEQGTKHQEPSPNTPEKTPTKGSALEALLGNIRGERKDDDEIKPFKCNICKVAYSQGSTLDIHIRSVLHQTKASKLQELILTGQIDLSKPLIEQPDPQQLQDQHKKMINEMLSPKSLNSTGSTANSQSSPNVRGSSPNRSSPHSSPLANLAPKNTSSPTEGSSSSTDEPNAAAAAAANMSNLAKAFPFLPNLAHLSPPDNGENDKNKQSPVLKNLLQNMGMELVKQFSEKQKQEREDEQRRQDSNGNDDHKPSNLSEVQEALQKAMLQAQLQQMNPMMMQMSQLQGMNPLAAMNIHPPLIPPSLLKGGGGAGNTNEITAALLAQMQSTQQLLAGHQQQMGGLSSLLPGMDPKLLALMAANMQGTQEQQSVPDFVKMLGDKSPKPTMFNPMDGKMRMQAPPPMDPKQFPPPGAFGQMPDPKTLLMQQLPIPNMIDQGKRARTRITDDQLKILRSYFDINNSPGEEQLTSMAGQTGLPMKVIKHWFRNTLFKERQKNKDSPYNFSNPPSTKLNMEEYEKSGESKVTPLNFEEQEEYVNDEKVKKEMEKVGNAEKKSSSLSPALKSEPVKSESPEANAQNNSYSEDSNATTTNKVPTTLNESSSESSLTLPRLLSSQLSQLPHPASLLPNFPAFPNCSSPLPPTSQMPDYLTTLARGLGGGNPQLPMPPCGANDSQRSLSPSSVGGSGKRANRTRFTDYQIKVLQEFFENNAYPKDDDLEYLSKLLSLSPRVIVVWFQNARQKARKIYENQPPADPTDEESGRFTRTAGCNYQCKKCLLVFQRYYELIRHQKQHCYKEEDAKRSALAQKAAGAAAAQFGGQPPALMPISEDSNSSADHRSITSPAMPPDHLDQRSNSEKIADDKRPELSEMTKDAVNRMFGGNQFAAAAAAGLNYPPNSQFGLLHQQALQQQLQQQQQQNQSHNESDGDQLDAESLASSSPSSPSNKRKLSDDGEFDEDGTGHQDKRLRTSILPEQLDFLGRKYSEESNPSRKMLEQIAGEVGLRKKVVQVWFQNARARERKGQSPLTKDDCTAAVATAAGSAAVAAAAAAASDRPALPESPFAVSDQIASLIPNSASAYNLQDSMRKYYEDTMKRFMNDINNANNSNALQQPNNNGLAAVADNNTSASSQHHLQQSKNESAAALDLTSNFDDSFDHMEDSDMANKSVTGDADCALGGNIGNGGIGSGGSNSSANKRFRTQMSGVQVKMMKGIFEVYKTPTMSECSNLGQEIGLQKRVVQVWFQNARAKEKRAKLQLQQATGSQEEVVSPSPDSCKVCIDFHYGHKNAVQDHLFTRSHLDNLRVALEQGRYDPESPGVAMTQTANALLQQQNGGAPVQSRNSSTDGSTSLPTMLQMPSPQVNSRELLEIASHQNSRMLMQV